MNTARTLVGKNVNVYLKDGSVILNVKVVKARSEKGNGGPKISCIALRHKTSLKIRLKEIAWTEQLNPYFAERA
jgi:hypothetical protein